MKINYKFIAAEMGMTAGVIAGIVVGGLAFIACLFLIWKLLRKTDDRIDRLEKQLSNQNSIPNATEAWVNEHNPHVNFSVYSYSLLQGPCS